MDLDTYLARLDKLIDPQHVARADALQKDCWDYRPVDRLPVLVGSLDDMSKERHHFIEDWPLFPYGEVFRDPEKMLLDELIPVYEGALLRDDKMYTVRPNFGVGVVPALLGCEVVQEGATYPWVRHLESLDGVKAILDRGAPPLTGELMDHILAAQALFAARMSNFENLSKTVHVATCDPQGPFNIVTECLGPAAFMALYDEPDTMHAFLDLVTDTYIRLVTEQKRIVGEPPDGGYQMQYRLKGGTRICEDNGLSISPEMYREFCMPYNERALAPFCGGYILLCGAFRHQLENVLATKGVTGLTIWSEDPDDLRFAYEQASRKEIAILWYGQIPDALRDEMPTGVITKITVSSLDEGREVLAC